MTKFCYWLLTGLSFIMLGGAAVCILAAIGVAMSSDYESGTHAVMLLGGMLGCVFFGCASLVLRNVLEYTYRKMSAMDDAEEEAGQELYSEVQQ